MKAALEWMADNHVAANLLMIFIVFLGFTSLRSVNVEVFPEVASDMVQISVTYPGASPDEIEESICIKIEEQIKSIEGIDRITSNANENVGVVNAELELGEDLTELKDKIKSEIDRITTFPENAEEPVVKEAIAKYEVLQLAIYGSADEKTLKRLAEQVKDRLLDYDGISQIELSGVRQYEISINVSEDKLRSFSISFDQISQAVRAGSLDLPAGKVTTKAGEILLRTKALGYTKEDYENIILSTGANGEIIRIKDVAEVIDGFEDSDLKTSFNGKSVAMLKLFRVGDQSAIEISDQANDLRSKMEGSLPDGIEMGIWLDQSRILRSRMDLLVRNAMQGLLLVVLALAFFLEVRLAMWVSSGIVISFAGSFFFMSQFDASINMISLFAFILVIGIVVDDAIVVGENIFSFRERGDKPASAAKKGVSEVMTPVVFSVSTTIAAFAPLLFVDGFMGKFMRVLPIIVISVLVLSLIESLMILPAHLSSIRQTPALKITKWFHALNEKIHKKLDVFIKGYYTRHLKNALRYRYLTLAISLFLIFISIGVVQMGIVKFTFFPALDADNMIARITMPVGTPIEKTHEIVQRIENAAFRVQKEFDEKATTQHGKSVFKNLYSIIGDQPMVRRSGPAAPSSVIVLQPNIAEINVELLPSEEREFTTSEMSEKWREYVGTVSGVKTLTFQSNLLSAGNDIELELSARKFEDLQTCLSELKKELARFNGVKDIRDDFLAGKNEFRLKLKDEAASLGVNLGMLARQVRQGFYGEEALRIQRGKDEVKVMLRYPAKDRRSIADIENMRVRTPRGSEVPFSQVAEIDAGRGYSLIKRADSRRVISLIADVDEKVISANEVNAELTEKIIPKLQERFPDLRYSYGGAQKQQVKAMSSLMVGFMIAMFVVFTLLAVPFRSYIQPLVVMSAIPFGFIGAVFGHFLFGMDVSIMSMFGLVALAGIVVNDSLVLVDFINTHHTKGERIFDAVVIACQKRFRPIFLTSVTTFLGLFPIMLEQSLQAQFLIPMALSLGFGVLFSTIICLMFVPSGILIVDDLTRFLRRIRKQEKKPQELNSLELK